MAMVVARPAVTVVARAKDSAATTEGYCGNGDGGDKDDSKSNNGENGERSRCRRRHGRCRRCRRRRRLCHRCRHLTPPLRNLFDCCLFVLVPRRVVSP